MPLAQTLSAVILETILTRVAMLFLAGAGGDLAAARQAAAHMLAVYQPGTVEELCVAAQIVSFSFHAIEALSQACAPDISLSRALRLRGSAVSLNRESGKAQRRLDQLQQARAEAVRTQPRDLEPAPEPAAEPAPPHDQDHDQAQAMDQDQQDQDQQDLRIAASLKRAEARIAAYGQTQPSSATDILPRPPTNPM